MRTNFLVCTGDEEQINWLQSSLSTLGQVVRADGTLDEVLRLVELMGISLVFISLDRHQQVQQCALIESLIEERPMVAVVAVGDGYDSDLVIAAMRAGARDFVTAGQRGSEVLGLAKRQLTRLPRLPQQHGEDASVIVLYGVQAESDASLLATHLALAMARGLSRSGEKALLIDIGLPIGESKAMLGLDCNFHFADAVRNLRRLDTGVIESAFSRHESGLSLLCLEDESFALEDINSAELFLLLGTLNHHFDKVVINLCGQRDSTIVRALVTGAEQLLWYADQSVPRNQRNLALINTWRSEGIKLDHATLLVDRYMEQVAPDASTLEHTFGMPLAGSFPPNARQRLECRNSGVDLFALAPGNSLTKAITKLSRSVGTPERKRTLWQRIRELA